MPQFVFSVLQCEAEEYLENMLTYRHQVLQKTLLASAGLAVLPDISQMNLKAI